MNKKKEVKMVQGDLFPSGGSPLTFGLPELINYDSINQGRFYDSETTYLLIYEKLRKDIEAKKAFFIPGNVPSSKNSHRIFQMYTGRSTCCGAEYTKTPSKEGTIFTCRRCGQKTQPGKRPIIKKSELAEAYFAEKKPLYEGIGYNFVQLIRDKPLPVMLGLFFIRDSKRDFDFNNASQIVQDVMVEYHLLPDDNCNYMMPLPLGQIYGKSIPGVIIKPYTFDEWSSISKLWLQ